jgi:hypothetical protein
VTRSRTHGDGSRSASLSSSLRGGERLVHISHHTRLFAATQRIDHRGLLHIPSLQLLWHFMLQMLLLGLLLVLVLVLVLLTLVLLSMQPLGGYGGFSTWVGGSVGVGACQLLIP